MRRFDAALERFGPAGAVTLPFDPKEEWGKVRAPVCGTIDGYPFTTTVARYGGVDYLAFRREVREAAGAEIGATVAIEVALDTSERVVSVPEDLAVALADARLREAFDRLGGAGRSAHPLGGSLFQGWGCASASHATDRFECPPESQVGDAGLLGAGS